MNEVTPFNYTNLLFKKVKASVTGTNCYVSKYYDDNVACVYNQYSF